jgi:hypothetical protein
MVPVGFHFERDEGRRALRSPELRLTLRWSEDRWTHALELRPGAGGAWLKIATAIESDPARDDPARVVSPTYQDIEPHPFEHGVRCLLTGQAGPHHFSSVITLRSENASVLLDIDLADRCRAPVNALAATYEVLLAPGDLIDAGARRIVWTGSMLGAGTLELFADPPGQLAIAESGPRAVRAQVLAPIDPGSFTQRCLYHWRWTPLDRPALPRAEGAD